MGFIGSDATSASIIQLKTKFRDNVSNTLRYSVNDGEYSNIPSDGIITVGLGVGGLNNINVKVIDEAGNVASDTISVWRL